MKQIEIVGDLERVSPATAANVVTSWAHADPSGLLIRRGTFVVPADTPAATIASLPNEWRVVHGPVKDGFWADALSTAGQESAAVLTMLGAVMPGLDAAGAMLGLVDSDPMFGAAVARVQCQERCCLQSLPDRSGRDLEWLPDDTIAELTPYELVGDVLAPFIALRPLLLSEFGDSDPGMTSLAGALLYRLASGRRCGFRTVVANRAAVAIADADCRQPPPSIVVSTAERGRLRTFDNDGDREWGEFRSGSASLFEKLTARHLTALRGQGRPSLLLDMRNVGAVYNGTTFAALGAARGLHQATVDWDVAILASEEAAEFHGLAGQLPGWSVYTSLPPAGFNVALRLSQPWHIQEMVDLHRLARLNVYLMLDTICWDVVYAAPPHLEGTWQFLSASADGLLFISDFSRRRFETRFPSREGAVHEVCHLSFDPNDYTQRELMNAPESDYFLVIGNHLAHKDVAATADLLASAFPLTRIETLGPTYGRSARVTPHVSGKLADLHVQRLYAGARLAVFPSFYEGFGLPIVTALAYRRTLLARQSDLLDEVAAQCEPGGRLLSYRQRDELVECIGRLTHGEPVETHALGTALNGSRPRSWRDVGVHIDTTLRALMPRASTAAWRARDSLVAQVVACRF